jgi:uncharacterized protein (TIRG00374 family)
VTAEAGTARSRRRLLWDWRVWLGFAITALALAWTLRGLRWIEVLEAVRAVNPLLLALTLPPHVLVLWLRAARWQRMTAAISETPLTTGTHFRAVAIGYLALNILPLRIGEIVRPWVLARETDVRFPAALGTILVDRVMDFASLCVVAGVVVSFHAGAMPAWFGAAARALAVVGGLPLLVMLAIRIDRHGMLRLAAFVLKPLPERVGQPLLSITEHVADGVAAIRSTADLAVVLIYSFLLWAVVLPLPMWIGLYAFDIAMAPERLLLAAFTVHVFIALAVSAPAAPGFFGVFHFACREALNLFGISAAVAVAYGTLVHLGYWVVVSLTGALAAARTGTRLADLRPPTVGKAASDVHR